MADVTEDEPAGSTENAASDPDALATEPPDDAAASGTDGAVDTKSVGADEAADADTADDPDQEHDKKENDDFSAGGEGYDEFREGASATLRYRQQSRPTDFDEDYLIVAALGPELMALRDEFGADADLSYESGPLVSYVAETGGRSRRRRIRLICMEDSAGVSAAIHVTEAIARWKPRRVLMAGVTAAHPDASVRLGRTVLVATEIVDASLVRVQPDEFEVDGSRRSFNDRSIECDRNLVRRIRDFVEAVFDAMELPCDGHVREDPGRMVRRPRTIPLVGDITRLTAATGWRPAYDVGDMARDMVAAELGR